MSSSYQKLAVNQRSRDDSPAKMPMSSGIRPSAARSPIDNNSHLEAVDRVGLYTDYSSESRYNLAGGYASSGAKSNGSRSTLSGGSATNRNSLKQPDGYINVPGSQYSIGSPMASKHLLTNHPEDDDYLHEETGKKDRTSICSGRGIVNFLTLILLALAMLMLFAGYPTIYAISKLRANRNMGGFNIGATNGTGQVPDITRLISLQDPDTPQSARRWTSATGERFNLVFSDEFNEEGRTFWPGDDPYFEAVDIWYGATGDYEWLSPENANTTGGALHLTLTDKPSHNLNFQSAQLQSWNKFCFQGGYIEFSVQLPGTEDEQGWWPGLWTMGNLARPGYLGTTDGMWPYSYAACDSGILPNQTAPGRPGYQTVAGTSNYGRRGLSWLSGMRTPSCTCSGEDHPGPNVNVGRSAPELDILEAQNERRRYGHTSQSLQVAPFDPQYEWDEGSATVYDRVAGTQFNAYKGGVYQEALSALTTVPSDGYAKVRNPRYVTYGVEYAPDWNADGTGHVTWYMDGSPTWGFTGAAMPPRPSIDIGQRKVPTEPMSIIMNLHISSGFQTIDFDSLTFPAVFKIDYVRVYQPESYGSPRVSCDPPDHPTSRYIERHANVYNNANFTTWPNTVPKNRLTGC